MSHRDYAIRQERLKEMWEDAEKSNETDNTPSTSRGGYPAGVRVLEDDDEGWDSWG